MAQTELYDKLAEAVLQGDEESVVSLIKEAMKTNADSMTLITEGMAPGARQAGERFSKGEYFLPQLIMAGEAMKAGVALLVPTMTSDTRKKATGSVVIGSVEGDVHDIGKNIVTAMLIASGFYVVDLGVDVSPTNFIETAKKESADILAMGSYLSTTLPSIEKTIEGLKKAGLRNKVKVLVGGVAVTKDYASRVGADGHAGDAPGAVRVAERLLRMEVEAPLSKEESSPWRGTIYDVTSVPR